MPTIFEKFYSALHHPHVGMKIIAVWLLLVVLLWKGYLVTDDWYHRAVFLGSEPLAALGFEFATADKSPWNSIKILFSFVDSESVDFEIMKSIGGTPWWTIDTLKVSFWRPLTAFTHWIDYQLWPNNTTLMQYHSLIWHAGTLLLASLLFRQLGLNPLLSNMALLILVLDVSFLLPLKWIANRNAIIALFWGVATLILHTRWRLESSRIAAFFAPLTLLLALLSAEGGIAVCAYLFAFAVALDKGSFTTRTLSLVPAAISVLLWRGYYSFSNYGSAHSGIYQDPSTDLLGFIIGVIERGSVLLFYQYSGFDSTYDFFSPTGKIAYLITAAVFLAGFLWIVWHNLRRVSVSQFAIMGSALSIVPSCAMTVPNGRLLGFAALGGSILIAQIILLKHSNSLNDAKSKLTHFLGRYFIGMHIVLATIAWIVASFVILLQDRTTRQAFFELESAGPLSNKPIIIVNMPLPFMLSHLHLYRDYIGLPVNINFQLLAPSYTPLTLKRIAKDTLQLSSKNGLALLAESVGNSTDKPLIHKDYANKAMSSAYRGANLPFKQGEIITWPGMTVHIVDTTAEGDPSVVRYQFNAVPLENFTWLQWDKVKENYATLQLPAEGQSLELTSSLDATE